MILATVLALTLVLLSAYLVVYQQGTRQPSGARRANLRSAAALSGGAILVLACGALCTFRSSSHEEVGDLSPSFHQNSGDVPGVVDAHWTERGVGGIEDSTSYTKIF